MSALGEKTLFALLTDADALDALAREGLDRKVIPTEALRPVYDFALKHYHSSGKPPTPAVLKEEYGDLLAEHEVSVEADVDESIEWAIDDLKGGYAQKEAHEFSIRMGTALSEADTAEKVLVLADQASELSQLVMRLMPRTTQVDLRYAATDLLDEYDLAVATKGTINGMSFGLPQVDQHTRGIWDGELAVLGGGPKMGKSFYADFVAKCEWERERLVALFTLENSIPMTRLRLACQALHIEPSALYDGTLTPDQHEKLRWWVNDVLAKSNTPFLIFNPEMHNRDPHAIVQMARAYGADSLIVDQLTFMESKGKNLTRPNEIRTLMHALKGLISTGRRPLPCLLCHQINREGVEHAEKTGKLKMRHMAEGAEVERTADMVLTLYASADEQAMGRMTLSLLAGRRMQTADWDLGWAPQTGHIQVRNRVEL